LYFRASRLVILEGDVRICLLHPIASLYSHTLCMSFILYMPHGTYHTLISFGSTYGWSLNHVCFLRNPQSKHRCIIRKVLQHSRSQNKHCCAIRKVPQHSGGQKEYRCVIRKVSRCFRKKPVKNTKTGVYLAKWCV